MSEVSPSTIAKRAFYEAMKSGGESEAMWIAAVDAVVEECAKVAEICAVVAPISNCREEIAEAIRALKGNANG